LTYDDDLPNSRSSITARAADGRVSTTGPWAMLAARFLLFVGCQALFALALALWRDPHPWTASVRWWPVTATLANFICLVVVARLVRADGLSLKDLYAPDRRAWKRDTLLFLGAFVVLGPLVMLPSSLLALAIWGNVNASTPIMFQALPMWVVVPLLVLFPVSIALSELPAYFGYAMPRLQVATGRPVAIWLLASAALATQHVALPLVFDWRFALWRLVMYAPFALFVGWAIWRRPTLMPYFMGIHVLLDTSVPIYVLLASLGRL